MVTIEEQTSPRSYRLTFWIFLRGLGIIYLIAFSSLSVQLLGLLGSKGLLPIGDYLNLLSSRLGIFERLWKVPTIFWISSGDFALQVSCYLGIFLSILLLLNIAPKICCAALWGLYLSFVVVGQDFFSFQWDNLLLEVGLLAIFIAPTHLFKALLLNKEELEEVKQTSPNLSLERRGMVFGEREPPRLVRWLFVWLVIRFHVQSGLVKWLSGDETWRSLTAMDFYYETAPIPTLLGWWAFQLPHWFHALSVMFTFAIEMIVPFFLLGSKKWRLAGFFILISFQVVIQATGNYTFFNFLTILLCLMALDDSVWCRSSVADVADVGLRSTTSATKKNRLLPKLKERLYQDPPAEWFLFPDWIRYSTFWVVIVISFIGVGVVPFLAQFRSINSYGLFAAMTTERWELEIQGSVDGQEWKTYEFKYKLGDLRKAPPFVAPHQPRLDFQCWFLTFDGEGDFKTSRYLVSLLKGICAKEPEVLKLLATNPFPDMGPQYLRLWVRRYEMCTIEEKRKTGCYWKITESNEWSPVLQCR